MIDTKPRFVSLVIVVIGIQGDLRSVGRGVTVTQGGHTSKGRPITGHGEQTAGASWYPATPEGGK